MGIGAVSFRRALGRFASGVTVVTTRDSAGRVLGLTVSAFCSVSLHPPLVLVCVGRQADANDGLRESGRFAVSVLREDQAPVSRRFASSRPGKLEGFAFLEGRHGLPLVPDAVAHLQCRIRSVHDGGDHTVWIGEVTAAAIHRGRPLLYFRGGYGRLDGVARMAAIEYKQTSKRRPPRPETRSPTRQTPSRMAIRPEHDRSRRIPGAEPTPSAPVTEITTRRGNLR